MVYKTLIRVNILVFKRTEQTKENKEGQKKGEKVRNKLKTKKRNKKLFRLTLKKGFDMKVGNIQTQ